MLRAQRIALAARGKPPPPLGYRVWFHRLPVDASFFVVFPDGTFKWYIKFSEVSAIEHQTGRRLGFIHNEIVWITNVDQLKPKEQSEPKRRLFIRSHAKPA